ncbi:MAG: hypothetical protein HY075_16305 [Deltaproteobacteria bacterium]|nr:hypothetical protein [Deltaproteobacteria bacterium]
MMKKFSGILGLALFTAGVGAAPLAARAADVNCYNDDSLDVINQDGLRVPIFGGPAPIPVPADCSASPTVSLPNEYGNQREVRVDGKVVYDGSSDPAVEARVAPTGIVVLRTMRGSLYVYRTGRDRAEAWLEAGVHSVRDFRLARNGALLAISNEGALLVDGRVQSTIHHAERLYASASGRVVALLDSGAVVDRSGVLFEGRVDGAQAVKVAADGTVVWLTRDGKIGSTKHGHIYGSVDPAEKFKVNPSGHVAYLTREGRLGRDGRELSSFTVRIVSFTIQADGSVAAMDSDGNAVYFR